MTPFEVDDSITTKLCSDFRISKQRRHQNKTMQGQGRVRPLWVLCTQYFPAFLQQVVSSVMNSTCIHLRVKGPNIYMYRRGRKYKEPPGEIQ
jgi:hypothetical protein